MFKNLQMQGATEERNETYVLYGERAPEGETQQLEILGRVLTIDL